MENQSLVAVKIAFYGEMHRVQVDIGTFTLSDLKRLFTESFKLPEEYLIRYVDNEGDIITVCNDSEFVEALRVFLRLNGETKTLSFHAICACPFKDKVKPIVKAVEHMAECVACAANNAMEKAKASEFPEKCRQHAHRSAKCAHEGAKRTGKFLADHGRRFSESEAAQNIKVFAEEVNRSLNDIFNQARQRADEDEATSLADEDTAVVAHKEVQKEDVTQAEDSQAETCSESEGSSVASQEEWDMVTSPKSVQSVPSSDEESTEEEESVQEEEESVQEEVASVVESASSEEEDEEAEDEEEEYTGEWQEEVALIRELLPNTNIGTIVSVLDHHRGNMNVAINALMDM